MLLQLSTLNREALGALRTDASFPPVWRDRHELERATNESVDRLKEERRRAAKERGTLRRIQERFDALLWTEEPELLDRPDVPDSDKLEIVRALDLLNRTFLSYHRFLRQLRPFVEAVKTRTGRPARVLELASGSGEFTLALAALAKKKGLPVEITGSDIVPAYIDEGKRAAAARGLEVDFRVLNAFALDEIESGAFDLVFIAQTMHHFTPGQLAMLIAEGSRVASTAFVGIDGARSLLLFGFLPLVSFRIGDRKFLHDALISARRFRSVAELELIARIAAPSAAIRVRMDHPFFTVLTVEALARSARS
jgi:SAM-dependent methyltransferase